MSKRKYIKSWVGLESKRDELKALAYELVAADAETDVECKKNGLSTIGVICIEYKNPNTTSSKNAAKAAEILRAITKLTQELIWSYNMHPDVVRRETAIILDPTPKELALCDALISK